MSTDPMTVRHAIETLGTLATSVDLDVPPADFPTWAGVLEKLAATYTFDVSIRDDTAEDRGYSACVTAVVDGVRWRVHAEVPQPPADVVFEPSGTLSVARPTVAQLDYLAEPAFKVGDTVERINEDGHVWYRGVVEKIHSDPIDAGLFVRVTEESAAEFDESDDVGTLRSAPFTAYGFPCWRKVNA